MLENFFSFIFMFVQRFLTVTEIIPWPPLSGLLMGMKMFNTRMTYEIYTSLVHCKFRYM